MSKEIEWLRDALSDLPTADTSAVEAARVRNGELTKPPGALGRLEEMAVWLAGWQGAAVPTLDRVQVLVFAGNHGVVAQGVSAFPAEVTVQMVANFQHGGAAINQLCRANGATLDVHALELERPTADFTTTPAMSWSEFADAVKVGIDKVDEDAQLIGIGEMGIGNTTVAAALCHGVYGGQAEDWVGRGTGVDDAGLARKEAAVATAAEFHGDALHDPLEAARRLGGRELAAMAGAVLRARQLRIPVLIDGYVASAALAPFQALNATFLDHCQAAHCSAEPGHRRLLQHLEKEPLLDLGMRLGEASGAAVAIGILRAAVATHGGMATFAEAGVAGKSD